jgi:heme A synthase
VKALGRLSVFALAVTYLHLVFGGIVRITGSGMGCGDHWPKCNGAWLPPFDNSIVMIEWSHRLLALLVILSITSLAGAAGLRRRDPGVGGPGGLLRPAIGALVLVVAVALLGMMTVKLGNATMATVAHWTLALTLLAVMVVIAVRAGALGGLGAREQGGSPRALRSIGAGALLAFVAVVLGGLVAKFPGAAVACPSFPLCGPTPADIPTGAAHIQLTHRVIAFLLSFHIVAISMAIGRRAGEAVPVKRATRAAAGLVLLQIVLGAVMVMSALPAGLRALHQATGIAVWLVMFLAAYLAKIATVGRTTADRRQRNADVAEIHSVPMPGIQRPVSGRS